MTHQKKIAVYTITYKRLPYTMRFLMSLRKHTEISYDHFIVDNFSNDGTKEFLMEHSHEFREIILNDENKGLAIAQNQVLDAIGKEYDYIVKVDPDIEIVTDGWLGSLVTIAEEMKNEVVLSPIIDYGILMSDADTKRRGIERFAYSTIAGHKVGLVRHVGGG